MPRRTTSRAASHHPASRPDGPPASRSLRRTAAVFCAALPAWGALAQPEIPEELDFSEIFDWVIIGILVVSWLLPVLIGLAKKLREGDEDGEFEKTKETALPEGSEPIEPS